MDYEKAYTDALLQAKQAIKDCGHNEGRKRIIEGIFPELADPFLNWLEKQGEQNNLVEQLTAFAQHLNKRGAFREDLCMDFEHEAQSFIEMQNNKEL